MLHNREDFSKVSAYEGEVLVGDILCVCLLSRLALLLLSSLSLSLLEDHSHIIFKDVFLRLANLDTQLKADVSKGRKLVSSVLQALEVVLLGREVKAVSLAGDYAKLTVKLTWLEG